MTYHFLSARSLSRNANAWQGKPPRCLANLVGLSS